MASFVDGICNLIGFYLVLGSMIGIYIAPGSSPRSETITVCPGSGL
jgi:hypothetical protein